MHERQNIKLTDHAHVGDCKTKYQYVTIESIPIKLWEQDTLATAAEHTITRQRQINFAKFLNGSKFSMGIEITDMVIRWIAFESIPFLSIDQTCPPPMCPVTIISSSIR